MQGDPRHLPKCLSVEKVPRSPTLWGPAERESNLQYPLLPNKQVYPATTGEAQGPKDEWLPRLSRRESYEEALKVAHQRVLETAEVLRSDIERLSQGMRDVP